MYDNSCNVINVTSIIALISMWFVKDIKTLMWFVKLSGHKCD
jgi:hypothetical protein